MVQSGLDLGLAIPPGTGLSAGLQEGLRQAIRTGTLRAGTRLPSTRALAADLGVARGTVVDAYAQMTAEGWLTTRPASATVVADGLVREATGHEQPGPGSQVGATVPDALRHDLRPGRPEQGSFPRRAWASAVRTVLARAPDDVWDYGHPLGRPELRRELAVYLGRARQVRADPARLVVCAGFSQGLGSLASLLDGAPVAVEATSLPGLRTILERRGHDLVPVPVDGDGAVVDALAVLEPPAAAVMLTPAHQFPLGSTLSPDRRHHLLAWARARGAVIIEDDYDGEFRYDRQPVGALQGLGPDRVVYGGTTSKTLAPALRLGWLVLPTCLFDAWSSAGPLAPGASTVPVIEQLALAEMLRSGAYDRHVRRMRLRYRRRRDALLRRLVSVPRVALGGIAAGLHVVVHLPDGVDEADVLAACRARQVAVNGLDADGYHLASPARCRQGGGIIVGYATPAAHAFDAAIEALVAALGDAGLGAPSR